MAADERLPFFTVVQLALLRGAIRLVAPRTVVRLKVLVRAEEVSSVATEGPATPSATPASEKQQPTTGGWLPIVKPLLPPPLVLSLCLLAISSDLLFARFQSALRVPAATLLLHSIVLPTFLLLLLQTLRPQHPQLPSLRWA